MEPGRGRFGRASLAPAARCVVALLLGLALLPSPVFAAPGDLDPTFGTAGLVVTDLGADDEAIRALAARPDGKLLAAGHTVRDGERVVAVVRYNRDGLVDDTFGVDGVAIHDLGPGDDEALVIVALPGGGMLLGGSRDGGGVVVQLTRTGALDPEFGDDGVAAATVGPVVGLVRGANGAITAGSDEEVVRLNSEGAFENGFGDDGRLTGFGGRSLVVLADGGIVGTGGPSTSPDFIVWRATADGEIDGEFGTARGRTDIFPNPGSARGFGLLALPDGRLATAGYREGESPLAKRHMGVGQLRADGRFDTSFNGDGKRLLEELNGHDTAYALVRQPDGALVVAGDSCLLFATRTSCPSWTFAVARLRTNGSPDPLFGDGGYVKTRFPAAGRADAHAYALVQQPDGLLVAAGVASSAGAGDFALARYQSGIDPTATATPTNTRGTPTITRTASATRTPSTSVTPRTGTPTSTGSPTRSGTPTRTSSRGATATATATATRPRTPTHTSAPITPPTCPAPPPTPAVTPCAQGCEGPAVRVADIDTAPARCATDHEPARYLPAAATSAGDGAFFLFDDCHTGIELWRTDGSAGGTSLVKDVHPGPQGSAIEFLGAIDDVVLFLADDGVHGRELWSSDGTESGTEMLADLAPGPLDVTLRDHVVAGDRLFFVVGGTLWRSDGTAAGTRALREFAPSSFSSLLWPQSLTAFADQLFFVAPSAGGDSLWRSDGSAAGTGLVRLLGGTGCAGGAMRGAGGVLYLRGFSLIAGCELWRSDGTSAGTVQVRDILPGAVGSFPDLIAGLDDAVVFSAATPAEGREPWASDGTFEGTVPLGDLLPGEGSALAACDSPRDVVAGGRMFFLADDGRGCELWRSDGSAAGTGLVRELVAGPADAGIAGLTTTGDLLLFSADTAGSGREPWRSDGSAAGTTMLADLAAGADSSLPAGFAFDAAVVGDAAVFGAKDGTGASVLWRTDGTAGGTEPVTDFAADGTRGSDLEALTATAAGVLFAAEGVEGRGVWRADADSLSASRAALLDASSVPGARAFARVGEAYLYTTTEPPALWAVEGVAPARLVRELGAAVRVGDAFELESGALFFVTQDDRDALWFSDGSAAGTRQLSGGFVAARSAVGDGDRLLFVAGAPGEAVLWSSDGSAAGTRPLVILLGEIDELTPSGSRAFFLRGFGPGSELWTTDGTQAGTIVLDVIEGGEGIEPEDLVDVDGAVFFSAADPARGRELWRSDGSLAGTRPVHDIRPGGAGSFPTLLTNVGGQLFFSADDGCGGPSLWTSDGSAGGTHMVAPVVPLAIGSAGPRAALAGYDPRSGAELWIADTGTAALQADIAPGAASSFPQHFTVSGDTLYFAADDGVSGRELWAVPLGGLVLPPTPTPTATPPVTPTFTASATAIPTGPNACTGDCRGDGEVEISEIILGVNIALDQAALTECIRFDRNADSAVTIEELILALNYALAGCP